MSGTDLLCKHHMTGPGETYENTHRANLAHDCVDVVAGGVPKQLLAQTVVKLLPPTIVR